MLENQCDKIVLVSLTNSMGGAEQMLLTIADTIKGKLIFLKKTKKQSLPLMADLQTEFVTQKALPIGFLLLIRILFKYRKDYLLISSHAYLNAFLGFLKRIGYLKSKIIVRESTSLFSRYKGIKRFIYKTVYRLGYPGVELVICQTESMRQEFLTHNNYIAGNRVITLYNAISLELVKQKADEQAFDPLIHQKYICAAGRLIKIKGFDLLIKAFSLIADNYKKLNLMILGEGPERESLQLLIKQLGLDERVLLIGHKDNPYPYFKRAELCVVPSIKEGFPNVLLQMMALNTKVVSTICAGGIEDMPYIKKVQPQNVQELSKAIKDALDEDDRESRPKLDIYLSQRSPAAYTAALFDKIKYGITF